MKSKLYQFGLFAVTAGLSTGAAWSGTINVAAGGSIQDAIDGANHGDEVVLAAGTYTLPATLVLGDKNAVTAKRIHLKGAGKGQTIIKGAGSSASFTTGYAPEAPLIRLEWAPSHNGAIPAAGGISENSGTSIEDLTIAGWENSTPGEGYLLWAGGVQDVHIRNVAFESNNNRVAIYNDNGDGTTIENCDFRGTYYRFVYRGAGRRMEFLNNHFDVTIAEAGGIIALEYGRGTNALIEGNTFRHTVAGSAYSVSAAAHRTIWNTNPLVPTDGTNALTIKDNDFQFIVRGPNSAGKYPVPVAIENIRGGYSLSQDPGAPTVITGNTFSGYDYQGSDVVNPAVISTHLRSTVTGNAFTPRVKSRALLTGTGTPALNATGNFWGSAAGPGPNDLSGSIDAGSPATGLPSSIVGPVSIAGEAGTYLTISDALAAADNGDTITLAAGTFQEAPIYITKQVTIQGPNAAVSGTGQRAAEATIDDTQIHINAAGVVIEGVRIYQTNSTADTILVQGNAAIRNNIFQRNGVVAGAIARAITTTGGLTDVSITGNLFTGDGSGGFFGQHKTWQSGIYSNGGPAVITGNTFENCRAALNLDDFNAGIDLSGNIFRSCGTYLSFGGVQPTDGSFTISGNDFAIDLATPGLPSTFFNNSNVAPTFRINATGNTFGGKATAALTAADKFAIEARMYHRGRSNRNGVVDYVAGQQIEVAGTTIASAIDAAGSGDTVLVGPGTYNEDVAIPKTITLQGSGAGVSIISGPVGGAGSTVQIGGSNVKVDGFTITRAGNNPADWVNPELNLAGIALSGGNTGNVISNNEIRGNRNGIDINNTNGHIIRNNVIRSNRTGMILRNQTDNLLVTENTITGNHTVGILFLDASGGTNAPLQQAEDSHFNNNNISGNWYGQVVDRQVGGSLPAAGAKLKDFANNWYGRTIPVKGTDNSAEPGYNAGTIPAEFGGTATAPAVQPADVAGPASANIGHSPFLSVGTDTNVETAAGLGTYGFQGNLASTWDGIEEEEEVTGDQNYPAGYTIPAGTTVTIPAGTSVTTPTLNLAPNATLVVEGGTLNLGDGSTISGTFTIFNSFGSWNINGDTTFNISRSLALVTDIHVAAGATITVNGGGELILDGCVINSKSTAPGADPEIPSGTFNLNVAADGKLTVARSVVTGAVISNAGTGSRVFDNRFAASSITGSVGAVYHNVIPAGSSSTINTVVDGWANVADAASLENTFSLDLVAPDATTYPGRTLEDGNLFVQETDPVVMTMTVGALNGKTITAAEALLGFNSDLLTVAADPVVPAATWGSLYEVASTPAGSFGFVDSALGFQLAADDGTSTPGTIADVRFTAAEEGITVGFFRVQTVQGAPNDTRLTRSVSGSPSYLTPFTANTGELVIDSSRPVIAAGATAVQTQPSVAAPVNVFTSANRVFRNNAPVTVTFTASDAGLAGLDAADATNDLVLTAANGTTTLGASNYTVTAVENAGVTTYTVTLNVPASATTGSYTVNASVRDRSGNFAATTAIGSFVIGNEALVSVALENTFTGTSREVTFTATGGTQKTWVKTLAFSSAAGSVILEDVPAGTTAISAKTAWTLRGRTGVSFSSTGVTSASIGGLKGGDLNGDNVINTLDFSLLRFQWLKVNAAANIDGDSANAVNLSDYNILNSNFYQVGSAE